ncbi:MAG TPA: phenylacetate--CoA ligase [Ktedonobacteraceae bacterium]|nr:phenylacetate--CoA ligase [Ktedonobacteraceae bacterium]
MQPIAKKEGYIWNPQAEQMPRTELTKLQTHRLQQQVRRAYEHVPFYREAFGKKGLHPEDIQHIGDITQLPFTQKDDFRTTYPYGLFAVPLKEVVRLHASSGTTGKPVVSGYTRADLEMWGEVMARTFACGGVTAEDIFQNFYGYGLFTGGLGAHIGAERIGATVIPMSGGLTRRQLQMMEDLGATVIAGTPSYTLVVAEMASEEGIDLRSRMRVRAGFFGAEPWTEGIRHEIEERFGLEAFDLYGLTEIIGPGVASECGYHNGLHINEDHFYPEVIDPEFGTPVSEGQMGELLLTCLTREALPLLRYRTRDRIALLYEPCPCGRTSVRMQRVKGRTDDMLIVRGVNLFPSQIEQILLSHGGLTSHYQIVIDRQRDRLDELEVRVEVTDELARQGSEAARSLHASVVKDLKQTLGLNIEVQLVEPHNLPRSEGKVKRVVDRRHLT